MFVGSCIALAMCAIWAVCGRIGDIAAEIQAERNKPIEPPKVERAKKAKKAKSSPL